MKNLISVIIPVYNSEKYLKECLQSILNQTYKNFEIILINDGSTDKSGDICEEFKNQYNNIRVFHTENNGVSHARNLGIKNAKGEYIIFIDADDYISFKTFEETLNAFENTDLIAFSYYEISDDIKICHDNRNINEIFSREEAFQKIMDTKFFQGYAANKIFKTDIIRNNKIKFDEKIGICEDLLFCCQYLQKIKSMVYMSVPYYYYRQHEFNSSNQKLNKKLLTIFDSYNEILKIYKKNNLNDEIVQIRLLEASLTIKNKAIQSKNTKIINMCNKKIKENFKTLIYTSKISLKRKLKLIVKVFFQKKIIFIKKELKKVKKIINKIFSLFPLKNIIIMESNPDFTDSVKKVFDELIKNKVNENYRIVWFVNGCKKFKSIKIRNVKFVDINPPKYRILKLLIKLYYNYSAKIIIDSNKYVNKKKKEQIRIHILHGSPLKNVGDYSSKVGEVDYIVELSAFFKEKNKMLYKLNKSKFVDLGFPRNDDLLNAIDKKRFFPQYENKKIIVWLPTYREHLSKEIKQISLPYGIPCFSNRNDFEKVDMKLKENNVVILLKLHPAQDKKNIESFNTNNIKIITDDELMEKGLNLYQMLAFSDALITDYSAVYYDYLLTNNQIGLAISDIEDFKKKFGFIYDYYEIIKGHYIYNIEHLMEFIENVSNNKDVFEKERKRVLNKYHDFTDNNATKRVFDIIKKHL